MIMKVNPYVYKCIHRETKEFYIGYRKANTLPAELDLPLYRTSSKIVRPIFDDFDWFIVAEFFDGDSAFELEQRLIYENKEDPLCLNRSMSEKPFSYKEKKVVYEMPSKCPTLFLSETKMLAELGERIKLARLRRKLQQTIVSARCDISRPTLAKVERGDSSVTIGVYLRVLFVLGLEKDITLLAGNDVVGRRIQDNELLDKNGYCN